MKHNTPAQEVKSLETLFFTFFKIGLFTFGGGYAMIAMLEEEFIQRRKWLDKDEFLDMAAIAESTPGPVAINSATYLGYKLAGVPGAATATVAVCLPSFPSLPALRGLGLLVACAVPAALVTLAPFPDVPPVRCLSCVP